MPTGQPIQYSDIISPDVQKYIENLTSQIADLTTELEKMGKAVQNEDQTTEDFNKSLKDTVDITEDLIELEKQEVKLRLQLKGVLDDEGEKYDVLKQKLSDNNRERRAAAKLIIAEKGSVDELTQILAKERKAWRALSEEQRENDAIGGKQLRTIQKLDEKVKKLNATTGNYHANVGNYPKLMQRATTAITAWGVAAGLAIIQVGKQAFDFAVRTVRENQAVADSLDFISNKFRFNVAGSIGETEKSLNKLQETANKMYYAPGLGLVFRWLFGTSGEAGKAAEDVKKLGNELAAAQENAVKMEAEYRLEISQQKLLAEDRNADIEVREAAARRAFDLEAKIAKEQNKAAEIQVEIAKIYDEKIGNNETGLALAEAEAQVLKNQSDATEKQVELNNKLNAIQQERITLEMQSQQQELSHELALSRLQAGTIDDPIKQAEAELAAYSTYYAGLIDMYEEERSAVAKGGNAYKQYTNIINQLKDAYEQLSLTIMTSTGVIDVNKVSSEDATDANEDYTTQIIQGLATTSSAAIGAAEQNKELQLAQALINTFAAVGIALASPGNIYSNLITAAVALATGLANVAQISSAPAYAEGTEFLTGDSSGKDKILIRADYGERIVPSDINKHLRGVPNVELPNMVSAGMLYNSGLLEVASQQLMAQQEMTRSIKKMAYVDKHGNIHYLSGDIKNYV